MIELVVPETLHSSLFEEGAVRLNDDVQEWANENLKGIWTLSEDSSPMPADPVSFGEGETQIKFSLNIIMVQAKMRFENLEDATLFKLRWM